MTEKQIREWIAEGNLHAFYTSPEWERLRAEVLADDHYECQRHKARGWYAPANTVHHVNHLRKHPELALCKTYVDADGIVQRNLVSLCHACHEEIHGHRRASKAAPLTEERW